MTILYTSGNLNLATVRLVAKAVKEQIYINQYPSLKRVVLFNSPGVTSDQINVYRSIFGSVPVDDIPIQSEGIVDSQVFTDTFKLQGEKYIDLTKGQKTTSAQLYLAASLLGIDKIFYLSLKKAVKELPENPLAGEDYEYIEVPRFSNVANLAKLSYFDLIYYLEEIENIFIGIKADGFLSKTKTDLRKAVTTFFAGDSCRSAISDATTCVEVFILTLLYFLKENPQAKTFSQVYNIDLERQKDPLGAVHYFFRQYAEHGGGNSDLEILVSVPSLLSALRSFRNFSAHSGRFFRTFQTNEARVTINMVIECLRCIRSSNTMWEILRRK